MNAQLINVLVVDDEADITELLCDILTDEGYSVHVAHDAKQADGVYSSHKIDLVLLDIWMPEEDGLSLLTRWSENGLNAQVIMMSGHGTIETAVQATKLGAFDFIEKPISMAKLLISVENVVDKIRLEQKHNALIKQMNPDIQIVGKSSALTNLKKHIQQIADKTLPVCFIGSPGAGKNHYARYLHQLSRNQSPFIVVNASSLSRDQQVEAIFWGGSESDNNCLMSLAENGTLFIDEIADLEHETQSLLTQLIENNSYFLPSTKVDVQPNIRLSFATQYALKDMHENGSLNDDFYFAIQALIINVPDLTEYQDDIPEIVKHYTYHFVDYDNLPHRQFSMPALNFLRQYPWPGNVRELRNFIQRALVMASETTISLEETEKLLELDNHSSNEEALVSIDLPIREAREIFEKAYFVKQLAYCEGNIAKLADRAGLERTNLYRKLKSLGINYK